MAESFLVSRLSSLGDVVCTLPVAAALKASFPECSVTWAVDPRFAGIPACCTAIDHVVVVKPKLKLGALPRVDGKFSAALDMQGLFKSAILVATAQAERKVGYHWQREGSWLFSDRLLPDRTSIHIVDQYVDVARALGCETHRASFDLKPHEDDVETVAGKLKQAGVTGRYFVINPGAAWITKRWPTESFASVCNWLHDRGIAPVVIGAPAQSDKDIARSVCEAATTPVVDFCGQTTIRELVALIARSEGHLGGDTGSTHLAAALGARAFGLYSITKPARSCPYGQIHRCAYDPESLSGIAISQVLNLLEEIAA